MKRLVFYIALLGILTSCVRLPPDARARLDTVVKIAEDDLRDLEADRMTQEQLVAHQQGTIRYLKALQIRLEQKQGFRAWMDGVFGGE